MNEAQREIAEDMRAAWTDRDDQNFGCAFLDDCERLCAAGFSFGMKVAVCTAIINLFVLAFVTAGRWA
jgi:hypothetical protein